MPTVQTSLDLPHKSAAKSSTLGGHRKADVPRRDSGYHSLEEDNEFTRGGGKLSLFLLGNILLIVLQQL